VEKISGFNVHQSCKHGKNFRDGNSIITLYNQKSRPGARNILLSQNKSLKLQLQLQLQRQLQKKNAKKTIQKKEKNTTTKNKTEKN